MTQAEIGAYITKHLDEINADLGFGGNCGVKILDAADGCSHARMDIDAGHLNPIGSIHGGALFTLADTAAGWAVVSLGYRATSMNADIHYLRPGIGESAVFAEAETFKQGKKIMVVEVSIKGSGERELCRAIFTYFIIKEVGDTIMGRV